MRFIFHYGSAARAEIGNWLFDVGGVFWTEGLVSIKEAAQCDAGNTQAGNNCFFHCSRWVERYIASVVPKHRSELRSALALRARLLEDNVDSELWVEAPIFEGTSFGRVGRFLLSRNVKSLQFAFKWDYPFELFLPRRRSAFGSAKKIVAFEGILLEQKAYAPYTFEISLPNHN